ncbi:MAG: dockerin type I domain-containing protein [Phycisphaerae bacterium]
MIRPSHATFRASRALSAITLLGGEVCPMLFAGGSPENAILLVDPARPDSLQVANHYIATRGIPASNVIYTDATAANYTAFIGKNVPALLDTLDARRIDDHADYVIAVAPSNFFVAAPGLVLDGCFPVNRFSISGAYTMAFQSATVAAGGLSSQRLNQYHIGSATSRAFDSSDEWSGGSPLASGRRYYIGAMLGWTGTRGNSVDEIITMIDRSVAVDGTRPVGTFYFQETTDNARSGPRDGTYPGVVNGLITSGALAEHQMAILPIGRHDCQGIMTGWAFPGIATADFTILPGAFCDHLTSYAATFDEGSQEKLSAWIARGASASWGQVEEPCNYAGKFPHARVHRHIFAGLSLGEACFRSVSFEPFQGLLYGDPLTRPYSYLPTVSVPDAPMGTVSGMITITPSASTAAPGASIAGVDVLVDGVVVASAAAGAPISFSTAQLGDGWHDLRVLAYDNTLIKSVGRWIASLDVNNNGRSATCGVNVASGDLDTEFVFDVAAIGTGFSELRLVQNGRVLAATSGSSATFSVFGHTLGAGVVTVQAEGLLAADRRVRSAPLTLGIAATGTTPTAADPTAWSYTKYSRPGDTFVVELPATYADSHAGLTYVVLTPPVQSTVIAGQAGPSRVLTAAANATGSDTMTFRVDSPTGSSAVATVTIRYASCSGDLNTDGVINLTDLSTLLSSFGVTSGAAYEDGDLNGDGAVNLTDLSTLLAAFGTACD